MPTGKGPLRIAIEDFLTGFGFGNKVADWVKSVLERWENEAINTYSDMVNGLELEAYLPPQIKPAALRAMTKHQIALLALILPLLWQIITQFTQLFIGPFMRPLNFLAEGLAHTKHIDPTSALQALRRKPELEKELRSIIATGGLDKISIEGIDSLIDQFLTPLDYERLRLRGILSEQQMNDKLHKLGYNDDDITSLNELMQVIPTPNDLIYLSVKEAFDDNLSGQFQHDEGFPAAFGEWAVKQGLSQEWAQRYWRAHWNLPSFQQVAEMFQRLRPGVSSNQVTTDDVNQFLKMADYSPFWRERLKEIAYSPFTRVDVRRMYKTGTLNEQQVKEAYLDLGYDDKKAQALTEFTIAYEAEEETGIVRSSVTAAYDSGMIDRATAEGMLAKGGYDAITLAFYLDAIDFNHSLDVKKIKLDNIHKRYVNGLTDESTVNSEINQLALPAERVTAMLELWGTERENQTTLLTITQMEVLLERKIVTEEDYTRIAKQRGYTDESIKWTLTRIAGEAADKAQTEAEKAQADSERLNKSTVASQYQKDKSAIDVLIAQARAQITDIDVALHGELSADEIASLMTQKDELKIFITQQNVLKAQLKFNTLPGTSTIEV